MIKSCEKKKKQTVLEKPKLSNGISTNGVNENKMTNNVAAWVTAHLNTVMQIKAQKYFYAMIL